MASVNPGLIAKADFDVAIKLAKQQASKFKDNEAKEKKYKVAQQELENAKAKLDALIEKTKSITMSSGNSFYVDYVQASESSVNLVWLSDKLAEKEAEMTSGAPTSVDVATNEIEPHYDFIDGTKKAGKDLLNGKGLSNGLFKATLGVGVGELLAKGVTSYLAKEGIMQSSLGLFGLGKLGITNLPTAFTALQTGMTALWGFSPLIVVAGGAMVAIKAVPAIKHLIDKISAKTKENYKFEEEVNKMITEHSLGGA